ncbi:hypothetical protein [Halovivax gelatinilyticus]|uniref:hypothetical protein n=1 Tax=Halovivax gelatinilyticus TaxID=2961597 RepID=UPI0020CA39E1|nr:hypothetical protein [Halovivax gelatinilyticus]
MSRTVAAVTAALLVTSLFALAVPGGALSSQASTSNETYAGTHVDFGVEGDALVDFAVDNATTFSDVSVQSESDAGAGVGLGAVVDIDGAALSLSAQTETSATVVADSGAEINAHDTDRGQLVVSAGGESQLVEATLGSDASAEVDGETVVVTSGEREGAFLVVGDGEVTVNDEGDVAAELAGDAELVFRSYAEGERDEEAIAEESLIAAGDATVDLHVEQRGDEVVSEAVTYGQETSADARAEAEQRVELTIDRTESEGTIVLTTVSEAAVGSIEDLGVAIDGEAAVEASSQSDLEAGAAGEEPRYMITSHNEAEGEATVAIAVDHFSERTVTMSSDESTDDSSGVGVGDDALPGFGALGALIASLAAVIVRLR